MRTDDPDKVVHLLTELLVGNDVEILPNPVALDPDTIVDNLNNDGAAREIGYGDVTVIGIEPRSTT